MSDVPTLIDDLLGKAETYLRLHQQYRLALARIPKALESDRVELADKALQLQADSFGLANELRADGNAVAGQLARIGEDAEPALLLAHRVAPGNGGAAKLESEWAEISVKLRAAAGRLGETRPTARIKKAEAEVRVREWLAANAKDNPAAVTRDAINRDTGVSTGAISGTSAFRAFLEMRNANVSKGPREIPLTRGMRAVLPADCTMPEELAALIEEQSDDKAEQEARHERRQKRRHEPS